MYTHYCRGRKKDILEPATPRLMILLNDVHFFAPTFSSFRFARHVDTDRGCRRLPRKVHPHHRQSHLRRGSRGRPVSQPVVEVLRGARRGPQTRQQQQQQQQQEEEEKATDDDDDRGHNDNHDGMFFNSKVGKAELILWHFHSQASVEEKMDKNSEAFEYTDEGSPSRSTPTTSRSTSTSPTSSYRYPSSPRTSPTRMTSRARAPVLRRRPRTSTTPAPTPTEPPQKPSTVDFDYSQPSRTSPSSSSSVKSNSFSPLLFLIALLSYSFITAENPGRQSL